MQIPKPSFFTLLLMISFASVNAMLFTPALPDITNFFLISENDAQLTITGFLIGYALGQLLYGPLANRFGRKPALYVGIGLQIFSSFLCALAGTLNEYSLLVFGRFLLALGAGVGLKMTFTLVNECFEPRIASQKTAYLMLAFAISPGLAIALGGLLNTHFGWMSCFYAGAIYGAVLFLFVTRLPETQTTPDLNALKIKHLLQAYGMQFKNINLITGGALMGCSTTFVYVFAALAPFIAINLLGMSSAEYGSANILPAIGLLSGSLTSAQFVKRFSLQRCIRWGVAIASFGVAFMMIMLILHKSALIALFLPMMVIYFGLALVIANASSIAMSQVTDKAHGSAVMSFVNMALPMLIVLNLGLFQINSLLLPSIYLVICLGMFWLYRVGIFNRL